MASSAFRGDELVFVVLPGATPVFEYDDPPGISAEAGSWNDFASALTLEPPFRARVVRAGAGWAVGAQAIKVAELPADVQGEELVLVATEDGMRELTIDGRPAVAEIQLLEGLVGASGPYVFRARRLSGRWWETETESL